MDVSLMRLLGKLFQNFRKTAGELQYCTLRALLICFN